MVRNTQAFGIAVAAFTVGATVLVLVSDQGQKKGNPEENLPPNITQLTHFGERAAHVVP